ncbi:hypothetical protein PS652_00316 [Pseudomonas fluorescens]|uniref:Uncharacterized protein n=1 Tax=Pseudomonas fluorescens TaxID=294 RepID=A0A5E6PYB4_PSEFL|nr:hypothetical protein PS652_00626 [Pseudomonas fluorescens]
MVFGSYELGRVPSVFSENRAAIFSMDLYSLEAASIDVSFSDGIVRLTLLITSETAGAELALSLAEATQKS